MPKSTIFFFIPCKVSRGLFGTERQVTISLPDGRNFVAFVDERNVKQAQPLGAFEKAVDGWVKVFPVQVTKHRALVDVPTQGSFTEGPRIEIPAKELIQP